MTENQHSRRGSLTIVGTGIKSIAHITTETASHISAADRVLFAIPDDLTREWVRRLQPRAEPLENYLPGLPRKATYERWIERILEALAHGENVCVVFYGHPGVFTYASHESIRRARARGYSAQMLAAVSVDGMLFADLGIDPGVVGCVSYEATDFLIRPRQVDRSTHLLLWQAGVVGQLEAAEPEKAALGRRVLAEALVELYGPQHPVAIYQAAALPYLEPEIAWTTTAALAEREIPRIATLYLPPLHRAPLALERVDRLGIPREQLGWLEIGPTSEASPAPTSVNAEPVRTAR